MVRLNNFSWLSLPFHEEFEENTLVRHGIFVDGDARDISHLSVNQKIDFDTSYVYLLSKAWSHLVKKRYIDDEELDLSYFISLHSETHRYLWISCHECNSVPFLSAKYTYSADLPAAGYLTESNGSYSYELQIDVIQDLLDKGFSDIFRNACATDFLEVKSPFTGIICRSDISFIPTEVLYWYKFYDEAVGAVFFLVAALHHNRNVCIYIPNTQSVIMRSRGFRSVLEDQFRGEIDQVLLAHVAVHCKEITRYLTAPTRKIALLYGEEHMAHHLWNELSGIDDFLRDPQPKVPAVFEMSGKSEMYGTLDAIFPELQEKIVRFYGGRTDLIVSFYKQKICVMRVTALLVTKRLRDRIGDIVALAVGRPIEGPLPTVAFILRIENRTLADCVSFYTECADYIMSKMGKVRFVIDGRMRSPQDTEIRSEGEGSAVVSVLDMEIDIAAQLATALRALGAEVVVNVDKQVYENLFWLYQAKFFIGPWGTGLTRARWLANIPGLMFSNSWNLGKHPDFNIYDDPRFIEDPSLLLIVNREAVIDRPDLETIVPSRPHFGENFDVVFQKIKGQVDQLVRLASRA